MFDSIIREVVEETGVPAEALVRAFQFNHMIDKISIHIQNCNLFNNPISYCIVQLETQGQLFPDD